MEQGLLCATDGGNAGKGQDWSMAGKRDGNGGEKKFISCVREQRDYPGRRGLVKGISW